MAHTCNPSYSGGRDLGDQSSKPAQANSLPDPISKTPIKKRAGGVAQGVGPEFKPQYHKKKKKKIGLGCSSVVEHLPTTPKVLSSSSAQQKINK
jgi:hypothetical protein